MIDKNFDYTNWTLYEDPFKMVKIKSELHGIKRWKKYFAGTLEALGLYCTGWNSTSIFVFRPRYSEEEIKEATATYKATLKQLNNNFKNAKAKPSFISDIRISNWMSNM